MKNLLKIALVTNMIASCSCHEVYISEKDLQNDIFYYKDDINPYSGICVTQYSGNDQVKAKRTYKGGIMNGSTSVYYANGQLNKKGTYKDGEFHGKWEGWYKDGTKCFEIHHNEGSLEGSYITYHDNGNVKEEGMYSDNRKTGKWKYFDRGGNLVEQKTY